MLTLFVFTTSFLFIEPKLTWELLHGGSSPAPSPRRDCGIGFIQSLNKVVLFGGRKDKILNDTWVFDIKVNTWKQIHTASPSVRFGFVSGVVGNSFCIATGESASKIILNDVWCYDALNEKWQLKESENESPQERYGSVGGIQGNIIYVSHGFDAGRRFADTFSFDLTSNKWKKLHQDGHSYSPNYPHARCLSGGCVLDDKLFLFGGCLKGGGAGGPCPAGDSWLFDIKKVEWQSLPSCATPRTYPAMAALSKSEVILFGGREDHNQVLVGTISPEDQVAIFNVNDGKWVLKKTIGKVPDRRVGPALSSSGNGVYLFGGSLKDNGLYFLSGDSSDSLVSKSCGGRFFNLIALHGIFMFIGWGLCLQLGAFIARYLRHEDPLWFKLHKLLQITGLLISTAGFICGIMSAGLHAFPHGLIGFFVHLIGLQQFTAFLRPHKSNESKQTKKRLVWENFHRWLGRLCLIFALINCGLGLFLALAEKGLYITFFVYFGVIVAAYIIAESRLRWKIKNK